jgi:hypothetical protein
MSTLKGRSFNRTVTPNRPVSDWRGRSFSCVVVPSQDECYAKGALALEGSAFPGGAA